MFCGRMGSKDTQSAKPKADSDKRAEKILRTISLDPYHCVNIQLNKMCWDNLISLMEFFECSIEDLDKKTLKYLRANPRA